MVFYSECQYSVFVNALAIPTDSLAQKQTPPHSTLILNIAIKIHNAIVHSASLSTSVLLCKGL